jgi:hypothetical protein
VVTERPVTTVTRFLNRTFGLNLANRAEAREWLADGGWPQVEAWLNAHRNDWPDAKTRAPRHHGDP